MSNYIEFMNGGMIENVIPNEELCLAVENGDLERCVF